MVRVRQFGELRQSKRSHQSKHSDLSHSRSTSRTHQSTFLCVGCVNQSLSKLKQQKLKNVKKSQESFMQNQNYPLRDFQESRPIKKAKKVDEEIKAMVEYNQQAMRQKSAKKEQLKNAKLEQKKLIEQMGIRQKEQWQKARKRQRLLRQKCISDLKVQISHHESQKIRQKNQRISHTPEKGILEERVSNFRKQLNKEYRRELAKQVHEDSNRKRAIKEQARQQIGIKTVPFLDRAEKRQEVIHQLQEQRKIVLLEEARQREKERKSLREKLEQKKERQRSELQSRLREEDQAIRAKLGWKKGSVERYRKQLKQQIEEKQKRKQQSKQAKICEHQQPFNFSAKKQKLTKACDSCEKQVPQLYLTRFQRPL